jgi:hypothetical protein
VCLERRTLLGRRFSASEKLNGQVGRAAGRTAYGAVTLTVVLTVTFVSMPVPMMEPASAAVFAGFALRSAAQTRLVFWS